MKRKLTFLTIALFANVIMCLAQDSKIKGLLFDKATNEAMAFASVALLQDDGTVVAGAMVNEKGVFEIDAVQGSYKLRASYIGYKEFIKELNVKGAVVDAGTIFMEEDENMLKEVVVKSQLPKTQLKGDAVVTNIAGTVLEHAGNANDVLAKVPGMINRNGTLEVLGRGEPQYYINGRKVTDASELRNLMAEDIQSIEVVNNPGALYAGDVMSVVRIKTVKRQGEGLSYALTSQAKKYTTCRYLDPSWTVLDVNYRVGGLDFFGKFVHWAQHGFQISEIDGSTFFRKDGVAQSMAQIGTLNDVSYQGGLQEVLGANWQINDRHSMGFKLERSDNTFSENRLITETDLIVNGAHDDHIYSVNNTRNPVGNSTTGNLYYDGNINKLNINFNADFVVGKTRDECSINEDSWIVSQAYSSAAKATTTIGAAKLILSYPVWKGSLQVGSEETYFDGKEQYAINNSKIPNTDFKAYENTIAGFAQYSLNLPFGQMSAGLRYEHVDYKYHDLLDKSNNLSRKQNDWFPSVSFSTKIGGLGLSLSYTGKTVRPAMHSLSTEMTYINRYTYQIGDPTLLSEKQRTASLQAVWKWLSFSSTFDQVKNGITQWASPYDEDGVVLLKYSNVDATFSKVSFYVSAAPSIGCWQPRYTLGFAKQNLNMDVADIRETTGSRVVHRNKPMYLVQANNAFKLKGNWLAELNYQFVSKMSGEIANITKPQHNLEVSLQKSFLKDDALTFKLSWVDILNSTKEYLQCDFGSYIISQSNDRRAPGIVLRASYRFNSAKSKYKGTGAGQSVKDRL